MSSDLQAAFQVTTPSGAPDTHMLLIFAIMLGAGVLGGIANYFLAERQHADAGRREWLRYPVLGVVAALTVPLFLNMISSTLLEGARTKPVDFFTFAGFCLLYVIATRRFVENVVQRLTGQLDQVRREVVHLKQQKQVEQQQVARESAVVAQEAPAEPREVLSYNDVEILRALAEESFVYGNLAALCDSTGLARDFISHRLTVMKAMGVIETRINDKNVLHWSVSARGKAVLGEILGGQNDKKSA